MPKNPRTAGVATSTSTTPSRISRSFTLAVADDGSVLVSAEGPAFAAWLLPGAVVPAAEPETAHDEPLRDVVDGETPTPADVVAGESG